MVRSLSALGLRISSQVGVVMSELPDRIQNAACGAEFVSASSFLPLVGKGPLARDSDTSDLQPRLPGCSSFIWKLQVLEDNCCSLSDSDCGDDLEY